MARPNVFEIDLDAIAHNVREIRRSVGADVRFFAAVKANGYGFGLVPVGRTLQDAGVDVLAVADVLDAIVLAEQGISAPILIYGGNHVSADVVHAIEGHGFFATITDAEVADAYSRLAASRVKVFVEVDVGLERFGLPFAEAPALIRAICRLPKLELTGMYAHLHVPKGADAEPYIREELRRFGAAVRGVRDAEIDVRVAMAASTPELLRVGRAGFNGIDVGRIVYGNLRSDTERDTGPMRIRQAFASLRSRLVHCRDVREQERADVSPFPVHARMRIGIAPIGYSDGIEALHCGAALVRGRRVPIVGTPSLEHIRLDISSVPEAQPGDEVVFIGRQGASEITVAEVLNARGFDQPTRLSVAVRESVPRVYRVPPPPARGARPSSCITHAAAPSKDGQIR
jgi:alanine racemase